MTKRKLFNILFVIFALVGFTGHVWGANIHTTEIPDNYTPEQKNLMNYIMTKSNCDLGEATLVLQMLSDQLSDTQNGAFLLYMMNPNAPANLPGLDPAYTLNDYFTNDYQYKSLKTRFDQDLEDFGKKSHKEKLEYCKHSNNDLFVLIQELSDSGDINKINYVLENSGLYGEKFNNETQNITDKMQKDKFNPVKLLKDGEALKSAFDNMTDPVSDAVMEYEYLESMDINPVIIPDDPNFNNIDNALGIIDNSVKRLSSGIAIGVLLIIAGAICIPIGLLGTAFTAGALTPFLVLAIAIMAVGVVMMGTCAGITADLNKVKKDLQKIKDNKLTNPEKQIHIVNKDAWCYTEYVTIYDKDGKAIYDKHKSSIAGVDKTFNIPQDIWNNAEIICVDAKRSGKNPWTEHHITVSDDYRYKRDYLDKMEFVADSDSSRNFYLTGNGITVENNGTSDEFINYII